MITLYDYWRSSAAYRVRMALNLLGLPYTSVPVNLLAGEHLGAENLARNPQGLVPTLQIDGLTLTQSLAIMEYLDETRGCLLPRDAPGRARVRALSYAIAMEIAPVCNLSVRTHIGKLFANNFSDRLDHMFGGDGTGADQPPRHVKPLFWNVPHSYGTFQSGSIP